MLNSDPAEIAQRPAASVAAPPFTSSIGCVGMVEASTGNIAVGTPVAGVIAEVYVHQNEAVSAGDPLFRIDARDLEARLPAARALVQEASAKAAMSAFLVQSAESLKDAAALSRRESEERGYVAASDAAALAARRAEVAEILAEIDRRTVRSPVTGRVLQLRARAGEFAAVGPDASVVLVGDDTRLLVRAEVDESQTLRLRPESRAVAFARADPAHRTALHFERIEPVMIPKSSFVGDGTERSDTRVLQVVYSFDPAELPAYVGATLDVYIEAPPP